MPKKEVVMAQSEGPPKPPYLSFKTFIGIMDGLGMGLPTRIDRSLFPSHSGAVKGTIISALEYLGLISDSGIPTPVFKEWVDANEEDRPEIFKKILRGQYKFVFSESLDLEKATTGQLEEAFRDQGVTGETVRKGMTFLLQACDVAKIPVSPHIKPRRNPSSTRKKRSPSHGDGAGLGKRPAPQPPSSPRQNRGALNLEEMLLAKFPEFNPDWPPEQQEKWFDSFRIFQQRIMGNNGNDTLED